MPSTIVDNSEHFTLSGPFGLPVAICVVVLLLVLLTWSLRRERKILGRQNTILFWCLRVIALATVVWMLLAPTNVQVETSTTRKSIAFVTDVSGSMLTVDPPGVADNIRWAAMQYDSAENQAITAADSAVVAAGMAERFLSHSSDALKRHERESLVAEATNAANQAIERTRENVAVVAELNGSRVSQAASNRNSLADRVLKSLDGPEFKAFSVLAGSLRKGRTPSQKGWRESVPDLEHRMTGIRRQLRELARITAKQNLPKNGDFDSAAFQQQPRLARAAGLLSRLQSDVLIDLEQKVDVRQSSFDQSLTRLTNSADPASELLAVTSLRGDPSNAADPDQLGNARSCPTDLSAVLEQLNRERVEQPLAAAFILTDVMHNRRGTVDPRVVAAEMKGTPVYVVPIGNTQHVRDIRIQSVFGPNVAMRNDNIVIEVTLQAHDCDGETCFVQLLLDSEEIDTRTIHIDSGFATRKLRFERKMSNIGRQSFQVAVTPLDGEMTETNNFDDFEVNVTRSDIKVLLADEMPRWEYRYLAQLFRRDPKVECDELLFEPRQIATGRRESTGTFPTTVDEWDYYDVVMLGDIPPNHLPAASQESLATYLRERGGTAVLIAGAEAMPQRYIDHPLEDILPVSPITVDQQIGATTGFSFHVTSEGHDHVALMIGETEESTRVAWDFINQVSPIYEVSNWRKPNPSAHTLISAVPRGTLDIEHSAKNNCLLCWQSVGRGKVLYLAAPDTWRLRLLRGDRLHYKFWGQMIRWATASDLAVGSEVVRVRSDKSRYSKGDTVRVTVRLTGTNGSPVITDGIQAIARHGDEEHSAPLIADAEIPGQYIAEFRRLEPGVFSVEPTGDPIEQLLLAGQQQITPAGFTVQADQPVEMLDTRCDRALAQQIADITGGQVLPPTAIEEVLKLTNLEPEVSTKTASMPLWLQWKYLWIVFACLQTEWIIRKWKGLS